MADASRASGQLEFHDLMLREMRAGMADVRKDLSEYRAENRETLHRLDEHIADCDTRYAEAQRRIAATMTPQANRALEATAMFSRAWLAKKTAERLIDYAVFAVIILIIFAFKHGASLPVPTP